MDKSRFKVVRMEKDMQVMIIRVALLITIIIIRRRRRRIRRQKIQINNKIISK
jgi:hypothetical protein